jgi:circadian clock protein KaiC
MIAESQPSRLFIDALSDLEVMSLQKERLQAYWAALTNYLRNQQITTLGSLELNRIAGNNLDVPERPISIIADSIILLRSVELDGHLKHLISVLEMRDSNYDNRVCEYLISSDGLQVGEPFTNVGTLLSGMAGPTPKP